MRAHAQLDQLYLSVEHGSTQIVQITREGQWPMDTAEGPLRSREGRSGGLKLTLKLKLKLVGTASYRNPCQTLLVSNRVACKPGVTRVLLQ